MLDYKSINGMRSNFKVNIKLTCFYVRQNLDMYLCRYLWSILVYDKGNVMVHLKEVWHKYQYLLPEI